MSTRMKTAAAAKKSDSLTISGSSLFENIRRRLGSLSTRHPSRGWIPDSLLVDYCRHFRIRPSREHEQQPEGKRRDSPVVDGRLRSGFHPGCRHGRFCGPRLVALPGSGSDVGIGAFRL